MPFTPADLARRVERAERTILLGAANAVLARRPDQPVGILELAGGAAVFTEPGSPLNKLSGLGFPEGDDSGIPTHDQLQEVEDMYFAGGIRSQVEVSSLADPAVLTILAERGYHFVGTENVSGLHLDPESPRNSNPDIRIQHGDDVAFETWLDAMVTGFCAGDSQGVEAHEDFPREVLEGVIRDFASAPGILHYTGSVLEGEGWQLAGCGTMLLTGGVAHLCGASTLPDFRRRGVQTALLNQRLTDGAQAGCDIAAVTTQPGSRSQQNMHAQGFELMYVRSVLVKQPPD